MWGDGLHDGGGNYAPIQFECEATDLPIKGEIPIGLNGTLYRVGPNPQFAPIDPAQHHWFAGDGMVHAFSLGSGRASYRNRWVRTDKWLAENATGRSLRSGYGGPSDPDANFPNTGVANTNIVWHGGRLLALEERHLPFELEPSTLATLGVQSCGGALAGAFTAHPKIDPGTGELVFFGCEADGPLTPMMNYGTLTPDGRVTRFESFDTPYCSMVHDFAVTSHHVLFPILPLSGSMIRARAGQMPYAWEPDLGGYVGILRRDQGVRSLRWFRAPSCFVFHVLNAWEEGQRIQVDVMQYDTPPLFPQADGRSATAAEMQAYLVRWTFDLDAGTDTFVSAPLDEMVGEFPRFDERQAGLRNRFATFAGSSRPGGDLDALVWLDHDTGQRSRHILPAGDALSEPVFVPRGPAAPEGDGWLLSVVWRRAERRSDLLVLDTSGIERGPVATVRLPHRVPFGFHGNWVGAVHCRQHRALA